MRQFCFLIPVLHDADRKPHAAWLWDDFETALAQNFGGFSRHADVCGSWLDNDRGAIVQDHSRHYSVAFDGPENQLEKLLRLYREAFGQKCIYVAETSSNAYLLG